MRIRLFRKGRSPTPVTRSRSVGARCGVGVARDGPLVSVCVGELVGVKGVDVLP